MLQGLIVAAGGMGIVFLSLIILVFVIMGLERFFRVKERVAQAEVAAEVAPVEVEARPEAVPAVDGGTVAAISVAMARLSQEGLLVAERGASKETVAAISAVLAHLPEGVPAIDRGPGAWRAESDRAKVAAISASLARMLPAMGVMGSQAARPKATSRVIGPSAWKSFGRQQQMSRARERRR